MVPGPERVPGLEENKVGLSQPGLPPEQPCLVWEPLLELVGVGGGGPSPSPDTAQDTHCWPRQGSQG